MTINYRPIHPVHECLVNTTHEAHDWWYTACGGGHQMWHGFDPTKHPTEAAAEKGLKKWHCPGKSLDNNS